MFRDNFFLCNMASGFPSEEILQEPKAREDQLK